MTTGVPEHPELNSNCDRYGHPLRELHPPDTETALDRYLAEMGEEVTERWSRLYRNLYEESGDPMAEGALVEVIRETLREVSRDPSRGPSSRADAEALRLMRRVCLAGWECHGYLVPSQDWSDPGRLDAVRQSLKQRLLDLLDRLLA